ncbi:hypothetical protein T07_7932 [Trichinella nelsoni]|uniref:Uncharacterized protein n=1 Tax=Trichinella nelsoni TaxID=6336 RepID=A0A0V0S817_9BILA|nr:hypothetical protein T07_7932 [Trichinella nelsoni]
MNFFDKHYVSRLYLYGSFGPKHEMYTCFIEFKITYSGGAWLVIAVEADCAARRLVLGQWQNEHLLHLP